MRKRPTLKASDDFIRQSELPFALRSHTVLHVPLAMAVLTGAHGTSCCPRGQGSQELASHRVIVSQCLAQQQTLQARLVIVQQRHIQSVDTASFFSFLKLILAGT